MRPRPQFFIVTAAMELVRQPDLVVLLRDFHVVAQTPDYRIFNLRDRSSAEQSRPQALGAAGPAASGELFYRFPANWRRVEGGMNRRDVLRISAGHT